MFILHELSVVLISLEGVILAGIILLWGVTHFRDQLIEFGWLSREGWIARKAEAAECTRVWRVLREIGFRTEHFQGIGRTLDTHRNKSAVGLGVPLSGRLLLELKPFTVKLENGFSYKASGPYYIDSMGAMSLASSRIASLATLLDEWVSELERREVIPPFDLVLAPKDGNVTLVRQFLLHNSPNGERVGIICKGDKDRSRVKRESQLPHETDFDGFEVFLKESASLQRARQNPVYSLNVIAVDDNCTGGSSLCHAMQEFNDLVTLRNLPINRVRDAVVLFGVKSEKTESNFMSRGFHLHALLSLGRDDMAQLLTNQPTELLETVSSFKKGFGCESSRQFAI
jgi:hypothetical protein